MKVFQKIKVIGILAATTGAAALFTGCHGNGGGWMWSAAGEPFRAVIGLNMQCDDRSGEPELRGHVTYHDPAATGAGYKGVNLQGKVWGGNCNQPQPNVAAFIIQYDPIPAVGGQSGTAVVSVTDNGTPGVSPGDWVSIRVLTGKYAGYFHQGPLQGGNVTVH